MARAQGPTRRVFLRQAALAGCWAAVRSAWPAATSARPSFLLIVTDDQGGQMGCLGTAGLETPHMDGLARRGVLFRQAFCTFGSCSPARASMLTGLMPHSHGITRNVYEHFGPAPPEDWPAAKGRLNATFRVPDHVPTLVELLKAAGYRTGITAKFHLAPHAKLPFDAWVPGNRGQDVARFIENCRGRPFFLMHNLRCPHRAFLPFIRAAGREVIDPRRIHVPAYLPDTPPVRRDWAEYLTAVQVADDQLGEALAALRSSGREGETVVLFTGDNGPAFHRGKYSVYDFGLRVPLIAAGPGVGQGARCDEPVSHVDLLPTIADLAKFEPPRLAHGASLTPLLERRPGAKGRQLAFGEVHFGPGPQAAQGRSASDGCLHYIRRINPDQPHPMPADNVRSEPWGNRTYQATIDAKDTHPLPYRLLKQIEGTPPAEELFDLRKDPWCTQSVLGDPAYAGDLMRLRKALDRWAQQTDDRAMAPQW